MEKSYILDNVERFPARQLVEHIREGLVTFEELCTETNGKFSMSKRKEVKRLLDGPAPDSIPDPIPAPDPYTTPPIPPVPPESPDQIAWQYVDKTSVEAMSQFLNQFPCSSYASEANRLINKIITDKINHIDIDVFCDRVEQMQEDKTKTPEQRINTTLEYIRECMRDNKISKQEFIQALAHNHNLAGASVMNRLVQEGLVNYYDLQLTGIDAAFIQKMMNNELTVPMPMPEDLDSIPRQSTEIYFWGIPSSGKSCALGAILSVASSGTVAYAMDMDTQSQGYSYMNRLIYLFRPGEVGALMGGTPVTAFYEMGFNLINKDKRVVPITCIDMAGELMRSMYKYNARELLEEKDENMLDIMQRVLVDNRTGSRKLHIFVIEYGAENRMYDGLPQSTYLGGALSYIKDTGIMRKDTDGIYILVSKADKMPDLSREALVRYVRERYQGFYNQLENICKMNEINGGRVEIFAFSLGDVCFRDFCRFNPRPAENVLTTLMQRCASFKTGKLGKFISGFNK